MSAASLVFYIIHPDSVLLYQNVRTKDEMGQLTKNDFISWSLECLTLNLNIAHFWPKGKYIFNGLEPLIKNQVGKAIYPTAAAGGRAAAGT